MSPSVQIVACVAPLCLLVGAALVRRRKPRAAPADAPRRLGPYVLGEKIGEGGMGQVFRARHEALDRWCAIKLLSADASDQARARFENEARLTARLAHPNTITIHDFGRAPDGTLYYAMELLDGVTLRDVVEQEGPQPAERVIDILLQLCASLREAHGAGLVHRDVKPENIVLCRQGGVDDVVKLLDFGLVRESGADVETAESPTHVVGTPLYMSPEAIVAPHTVTARSDLYAVGAVGYFLLTGRHAFGGSSVAAVCAKHLYEEVEPPSSVLGRPVPSDLERILLDCLAKSALDRPASAAELEARLERCRAAAPCVPPKARRECVPAWAAAA